MSSSPPVLRPKPGRACAIPSADASAAYRASVECPTCGESFATPHCAQCGERRPEPGRLALRHLLGEAVEHFVSFDGTFGRTLLTLLRRPGALTEAYLRGARVRYTRPIQLLLIINVAFFLLAPQLGLFRYGITPPSHPTTAVEQARVDGVLASTWDGRIMLRRMRERHERWDQFVARYNAVIDARVSSSVGLLFVPPLLAVAVVCAGRGRYLVTHAVFMLHFAAFALVWMPGAVFVGEQLAAHSPQVRNAWVGTVMGVLVLAPLLAYLYVALRRVYGGGTLVTFARSAAVIGALAPIPTLFVDVVRALTAWLL